MTQLTFVGLLLACFAAAPATAPQKTVICFGDSLTKIGFGDLLAGELPARVVNAGKSGETSAAALDRLQKDVLDLKPDVVTLLYGTNDMVLDKPTPKVDVDHYTANLRTIIDRLHAAGAKVVLCTVPPINAAPYFTRHPKENYDRAGGLGKIIADYRAAAMRVADEKHVTLVDLNTLLAERPEWLSPDGVHPTKQGRVILARLIAAAVRDSLGERPAK